MRKNLPKETQQREQAIEELFNMVYEWGGNGIKTNHTSKAFRKQLSTVLTLLENE